MNITEIISTTPTNSRGVPAWDCIVKDDQGRTLKLERLAQHNAPQLHHLQAYANEWPASFRVVEPSRQPLRYKSFKEWQVRTIDAYGDVIDMVDAGTEAAMRRVFDALTLPDGDAVAAVLELQKSRGCVTPGYEWDGGPTGLPEFITSKGDAAALEAGGWTA